MCQYSWTARAGKDVRDPIAQSTHFTDEETEVPEVGGNISPEIRQPVSPRAGTRILAVCLSETPGSLVDLMSREAKPWKGSMVSGTTSSLSKGQNSSWHFVALIRHCHMYECIWATTILGVRSYFTHFIDEEMEAP